MAIEYIYDETYNVVGWFDSNLGSVGWFDDGFTETAASGSTGTLALAEAADTNTMAGATTVVGTSALTEAADTFTFTGTPTIVGTLALTEAADANAIAATTTVVGTSALTEALDTNSAAGTTTVVGTLELTEADDTNAADGTASGGSPDTPSVVAGGGLFPRLFTPRPKVKQQPKPQPIIDPTPELVPIIGVMFCIESPDTCVAYGAVDPFNLLLEDEELLLLI